MKFLKVAFILILPIIFCTGCNNSLPLAKVSRDSELTGGNLSFSVIENKIYFGGEGEFVQFYEANIAKGWEVSGNRVGIVLTAPAGVNEFDTGTLTMQGKTISSGVFYSTVNGEKIGKVALYPLVSSDEREVEIKITWQDGTAEQSYKVIINDKTNFMEG